MVTCTICGRQYEYNRKKGHTYTKCNSCMCNQRRFEIKRKSIEYLGGKCSICGYQKSRFALEFHHLNPNEKEFNFSGQHARRWEVLQAELDKCILVCANCHREIHHGL